MSSIPPPPPFARGFDPKQKRDFFKEQSLPISTSGSSSSGGSGDETFTAPRRDASRSSPSSKPLRRTNADPPPTRILDFLFLGTIGDAHNRAFLRKENIKTLINVTSDSYAPPLDDVEVVHLPAEDTSTFNIQAHFETAFRTINKVRVEYFGKWDKIAGRPMPKDTACSGQPAQGEPKRKVLVHCLKGRSRSAAIVIAYLIFYNGLSVAEAMQYVGTRRSCVEPNLGFIDALRTFQEEEMSPTKRDERRRAAVMLIKGARGDVPESQWISVLEEHVGLVVSVTTLHSNVARQKRAEPGNDDGGDDVGDSPEHAACEDTIPPPVCSLPVSNGVESAPPATETLLAVVFACYEHLRTARSLLDQQPQLFAALRSPNAELKFRPAHRPQRPKD